MPACSTQICVTTIYTSRHLSDYQIILKVLKSHHSCVAELCLMLMIVQQVGGDTNGVRCALSIITSVIANVPLVACIIRTPQATADMG